MPWLTLSVAPVFGKSKCHLWEKGLGSKHKNASLITAASINIIYCSLMFTNVIWAMLHKLYFSLNTHYMYRKYLLFWGWSSCESAGSGEKERSNESSNGWVWKAPMSQWVRMVVCLHICPDMDWQPVQSGAPRLWLWSVIGRKFKHTWWLHGEHVYTWTFQITYQLCLWMLH